MSYFVDIYKLIVSLYGKAKDLVSQRIQKNKVGALILLGLKTLLCKVHGNQVRAVLEED